MIWDVLYHALVAFAAAGTVGFSVTAAAPAPRSDEDEAGRLTALGLATGCAFVLGAALA